MSLFLGKIHFWLFEKIKWFEGLEKETLAFAEDKKIDTRIWIEEANKLFGEKLKDDSLENLIDQSNIHGWLQSAINSAEGRVAFYTTKLINLDREFKEELLNIYAEKGKENANEYLKANDKPEKATEIYNIMNDFILEGMPCDRISEISISKDEEIIWCNKRCLHEKFWNKVNGDVSNFYYLRNGWIESFVKTLNSDFSYNSKDGIMSISK